MRLTFVGAVPYFCLKRVRLEKAYENFGNWWQNLLRVMTGNSVKRIKSIFSCNFSIAKFRRRTQKFGTRNRGFCKNKSSWRNDVRRRLLKNCAVAKICYGKLNLIQKVRIWNCVVKLGTLVSFLFYAYLQLF